MRETSLYSSFISEASFFLCAREREGIASKLALDKDRVARDFCERDSGEEWRHAPELAREADDEDEAEQGMDGVGCLPSRLSLGKMALLLEDELRRRLQAIEAMRHASAERRACRRGAVMAWLLLLLLLG